MFGSFSLLQNLPKQVKSGSLIGLKSYKDGLTMLYGQKNHTRRVLLVTGIFK